MRRNTSTPPALPGYDYIKTLGSGGSSDVFLYQQRLPRRKVAVKVLLTEQLNQSTRARFVAEANLMAQLSTHPYIVTIYHADVAGDARPYFVMEYCSGPSLAERYKREQFSVEDALRTGVRLAGAIATAHGAGILHRDIKPANVLTNDFGWPALADFGISSTLDENLPEHTAEIEAGQRADDAPGAGEGQSVGLSVPWAPPEMFDEATTPDVRSDVFSLSATIHTLLAGQTPFEIRGRPNGTLDLMGRIERGAITPLDRDDVPRSLTAVLQKGMATRRADRYPSAVDLARALQRIELELGYAPTGIDVPNLHLAPREPTDAPAGEDETRVRGIVTIAAQTPAPVSAPTAPATGESDETRVRGVAVIEQGRRSASGRHSRVDDATMLRTRGQAEPDMAAPAVVADKPRRRTLSLGIGLAGVALAGLVAAAIAVNGVPLPTRPPTSTKAADEPGDANAAGAVPAPRLDGVATSVDGTVVTFTVSNSDPSGSDVYRWARAETPNQPTLSAVADIAVGGVVPGSQVCIDVYLQRRDGRLSEANRACNR